MHWCICFCLSFFTRLRGVLKIYSVVWHCIDDVLGCDWCYSKLAICPITICGSRCSKFIWLYLSTDFTSHCFYLYTAISYIFRKYCLRTALGLLNYFIIRYCDARLNATSITIMALIFCTLFRNDKQRRLFALLPLSAGIASSVMIYLSLFAFWSHQCMWL